MSTQTCQRCGTTTPGHFVACPSCHALFHAERLTELSREAEAFEAKGEAVAALERLRLMQPLLPRGSTQATQVQARITALEPKAATQPAAPTKAPKWVAGLGAVGVALWKFIGPLLSLLSKGKFLLMGLVKLPTLLSFFVSAALWRDGSGGMALALLVLASIYVHEMGHTWAFRRYGIAVSPPMFVPGLGAFVRGAAYPQSAEAAGDVALSGPVWGGVSGVVTLIAGVALGQPWLVGGALLIAEINLFNLFPVWQLDGSRASKTMDRHHILILSVIALAGGAVAGSPMSLLAGAGLVVRWFMTPQRDGGSRRTFIVFTALLLGLLALRVVSQLAMPESASD